MKAEPPFSSHNNFFSEDNNALENAEKIKRKIKITYNSTIQRYIPNNISLPFLQNILCI